MKNAVIKIFTGIIMILAGIIVGVSACRLHHETYVPAVAFIPVGAGSIVENMKEDFLDDAVMLRVRGGNLEWHDGVRWNKAGTVEELAAADPIARPSEEWLALAAKLADARAEEYVIELNALSRDGGSLLVDEIEIVRPQTTTPAVTRPTAPAVTAPTVPADSGSGSDQDDNDRHEHEETPAPEPAVPDQSVPDQSVPDQSVPDTSPGTEPEPDDTGDGENIEWSGDYE